MLLKKRNFNSKLHCACGRPSSIAAAQRKKIRRFGPAQRHSALSTLRGRQPSFSALCAWPSEHPWALSPNRPSSAGSECPWKTDESDGHPSIPLEQKPRRRPALPNPRLPRFPQARPAAPPIPVFLSSPSFSCFCAKPQRPWKPEGRGAAAAPPPFSAGAS